MTNWCQAALVLGLAFTVVGPSETAGKAKNPLVMPRRRHDWFFLQIFHYYAKPLRYEEFDLQRKFLINQTNEAGETNEVEVTYYENDEVEANQLTHDHLIVEAINRAYTTRLYRPYMFTYDDPEDRRKSSDKRLVSRERCRRDLAYMVRNLPPKDKARWSINPELAAMYDSFGRAEKGALYGNYHWTGMADQCARRLILDVDRKNSSNSVVFKGRYCTAAIKTPRWDKIIREHRERLEREEYFKYEGQQRDYERFFRINVGVCLPESCDSESIDWAHREIKQLTMHRLSEPYKSYELIDLFCLPDETSELRQLKTPARYFLAAICGWLFLIAIATYCDFFVVKLKPGAHDKSNLEKFVTALSLRANIKRLTAWQEAPDFTDKPAPSDLTFLNFFKFFFASNVIIWGHMGILGWELNKFTNLYHEYTSLFVFHTFISAVFVVDWFFTITGFITGYIMCHNKAGERNKLGHWLYGIFHRYWRLAPLYILVFCFAKYILVHLGSGPNWDYGTSNITIRSLCYRESWHYPLTLTSNYHPIYEECIMASWYVSNDFQFFLVTPFIAIGLYKYPKATWRILMALIVYIMAYSVQLLYNTKRLSHLDLLRVRNDSCRFNNWDFFQYYLHTFYRIGPYLMGLMTGHYCYMVRSGEWKSILYVHPKSKGKQSSLGKFLLNLMFITGIFITVTMCFASMQIEMIPLPQSEEIIKLLASLVYGTQHNYASLGFCLLCIGFMFGKAPRWRKFMSGPFFNMMTRMNYMVLMVQCEIIWIMYLASQHTMSFLGFDYFVGLAVITCLSYLVSAVMTPLFELPLAQLEYEFVRSLLMGKKTGSKKDEVNIKKRD